MNYYEEYFGNTYYKEHFAKCDVEKAKILKKNKREKTFILYDMEVIKEIAKKCLPSAKSSEFQVGYEAIRIEVKKGYKIVNFVIPTCYYNFKQTVTSVSVDWESEDLDSVVKSILNKVSTTKLDQTLSALSALKSLDYDINITKGDFGSIHRHPSKCTFSSTDLRNNPKNPGIIFRKGNFKGVQTDSLIYIPDNNFDSVELFHSESRRVDVTPTENGGVSGTFEEHLCTNIFYNKNGFDDLEEVVFDNILNFEYIDDKVDLKYFYTSEDTEDVSLIEHFKLLMSLTESYKLSNFSPSIEYVLEDNIKESYDRLKIQTPTIPLHYEHNDKKVQIKINLKNAKENTNHQSYTISATMQYDHLGEEKYRIHINETENNSLFEYFPNRILILAKYNDYTCKSLDNQWLLEIEEDEVENEYSLGKEVFVNGVLMLSHTGMCKYNFQLVAIDKYDENGDEEFKIDTTDSENFMLIEYFGEKTLTLNKDNGYSVKSLDREWILFLDDVDNNDVLGFNTF